jgi:hypothetical protein
MVKLPFLRSYRDDQAREYGMRHFQFTLLSLFAFALMLCSASAQEGYGYFVDGRVVGTLETDGLHLQIEFDDHPWGGVFWASAPAGIDVYRRAIGPDCGQWERITNESVVWDWIDNPGGVAMSFELVDASTSAGHGYLYQARAVDANRDAVPENGNVYLGVATNGVALLAHGMLDAGPGSCGLSYVPTVTHCESDWYSYPDNICYPPLLFATTPEISIYINTGTSLLLYGVIDGVISPCGVNETVARFSLAVPTSSCVVNAETRTWGSIKAIYR